MIHTPYHFVPLSDWVYMPDWAHLVSHDVPFQDGFSGSIDYTLTNATPLCVGAEQQRHESGPTKVMWARNPAGEPVIPGSSIKGMLRNVLEIASFGKFNQIEDSRFSYRDISSRSHYLEKVIKANKVVSGWVKYNLQKGIWEFRSCLNAKLKHRDLNELLKVKIKDELSAVKKFEKVPLSQPLFARISEPRGKGENCWAEQLSDSDNNGTTPGHVVFTNKKVTKGASDDYEFCYFFHSVATIAEYGDVTKLVNQLFASHDKDWVAYLKEHQQAELGIPVFMLLDKNTKRPHSFGLARMPRVSYQNSIHDLVNQANNAHRSDVFFDMAELIFGTLREDGLGLKSRVSISDFSLINANECKSYFSNALVLNSPKPTFYPAYLEQQQNANVYSDYDSVASRVNGWKRYISKRPSHSKLAEQDLSDQENVSCYLELLEEGAKFTGKLVFHNLKAAELGALLWAFEFEKQQGCYHSLGHGKPFGAGAVQFTVNSIRLKPNAGMCEPSINDLKSAFVSEISKCYKDWQNSPQIKNLLAMAKLEQNAEEPTSYMPLKAFQTAKNTKERLQPFNNLNRKDGLKKTDNVSLAFAKGRLAHLIDNASALTDELVKLRDLREDDLKRFADKEKLEQLKLEQEAEKQRQLNALSPGLKEVALLEAFLLTADGQAKPPKLREIVQRFLDEDFCNDSALQLHRIARKNDFHKTPKKKMDEHKQMLADLVAKYDISL